MIDALAFFDQSELEAIGESVLPGLQTDVTIKRKSVTTPTDPNVDYGDDDVSYATVANPDGSPFQTTVVKGWLWQQVTQAAGEDESQLVTVGTYRLYLPRSTNIQPHDEVEIAGEAYDVSDTNADITFLGWVNCSLRRLE